jgi:hypothetical protein
MLYFLVLGDAIRKFTLVTIDKKMKVSQLRETIRKRKENHFNDIKVNADQLILWKMQIPTNGMDLETEIHANDVKKNFRGKELNPFEDAIFYFNKPEYFSEEVLIEISIIIQPSQPAITSKCLLMVYLISILYGRRYL